MRSWSHQEDVKPEDCANATSTDPSIERRRRKTATHHHQQAMTVMITPVGLLPVDDIGRNPRGVMNAGAREESFGDAGTVEARNRSVYKALG